MTANYGTNPTDERRRQQQQPSQTPPQQQSQSRQPQYAQQPQSQQMGGAHQQQPVQQQQGQQQPVQQQQGHQQPVQRQQGQQQPVQQQQGQQARQQQRMPSQQQPRQTQAAQQQPQRQARQQAQQRASQQPSARQPTTEPYLSPARVNQVITEDVVKAEKDTPLRTIVAMMAEEQVGSVVIVEDDKPVGILTDRKIAMALEEMPDISERTAEEFVQDDLTVADPSMSLFDALQLMNEESIRRLPIVDDDGSLRGIVTLDDILVLFGGAFQQISETIEAQSPRL